MSMIYKDGIIREATAQELADFARSIPSPNLADLKMARIGDVDGKITTLLNTGYPFSADQHIALSDGSRADLTAMATTAIGATAGSIPWPDSYQEGWITIENTRIPLPTPAEGLALAAPIGAYYGAVRQHGRSLKDAILAADAATLDVIDIDIGWP